MTTRFALLATTALFLATAAQAQETQPGEPPSPDPATQPTDQGAGSDLDYTEGDAIVVTGQRRGIVIGDIPPENSLTTRDVLATGANDINELLDALGPQIGSARGRGGERPVMLLNGERISSFRELRDIPTEAIERVDILPEEVALKYGYSADQRVVNIVLRPRFHSTTAQLRANTATEGGYLGGEADVTRLMIGKNGRTSVNFHAEGNGALTESERNIILQKSPGPADSIDQRTARTLIGSKRDVRGAATLNRKLGEVSATLNTELEHQQGRSLFGLSDVAPSPLARRTTSDTAHAGLALNWGTKWRWSSTANADLAHDVTRSDRETDSLFDRALSTRVSADADLTAHGDLFHLPAGDVGTTAKIGVITLHQKSERRGPDDDDSHSLGRTSEGASVNLDVPVSRRSSDFGALGNLTLNGNAKVSHLSDFGTLTTFGAGANWSVIDDMNFIASWTREDGAPSVQQLGDPIIETPDARIFDFTKGETVFANVITGGNPNLISDRRSVFKLGGYWKPLDKTDLRIRTEYVHTHIDHPISNFPGPTPGLEEAFPGRFVRNGEGELVSVDLRPVNFDSSRRDTLRIGIDFSKPLKSAAPSEAQMAEFRKRRQGSGRGSQQQASTEGGRPQASEQRGRGSRGGRFFGNRDRGRLQLSLTDSITFVDRVTIRPGMQLDFLHGDALGQTGGRPRHDVEARAGYFNNGLGARLSGDWRSGTTVDNATGERLRFSPYATFDLRLWANLGQRFDLVSKHPWLRGSSVRLQVTNMFDTKPKVHTAAGDVPLNYQPDLLEPLGRTISISFRKLFLPRRGGSRRGSQGGGED